MEILGVRIDNIDFPQALEKAKKLIEGKEKHYIVTPNPEFIVLAQKDAEFRKILNSASLSIPDGIGLVWAAKILRKNLPERVTGVDLLEGLAALAAEHGFNIFLLGGKEGVAAKAAEVLKTRYPKLEIAGIYGGKAEPEFDALTRSHLVSKKIDILAVAYGPPRQEKWIARNLPYIDVKLAIGVGGALDYISGEKSRAPGWVRGIGLEWFHRLISEPSRWRRQLNLPYFAYLVFRKRLERRLPKRG